MVTLCSAPRRGPRRRSSVLLAKHLLHRHHLLGHLLPVQLLHHGEWPLLPPAPAGARPGARPLSTGTTMRWAAPFLKGQRAWLGFCSPRGTALCTKRSRHTPQKLVTASQKGFREVFVHPWVLNSIIPAANRWEQHTCPSVMNEWTKGSLSVQWNITQPFLKIKGILMTAAR